MLTYFLHIDGYLLFLYNVGYYEMRVRFQEFPVPVLIKNKIIFIDF